MRKDRESRRPLSLSRETLADLAPSVEQTLGVKGGASAGSGALHNVCLQGATDTLGKSTFSAGGGCAAIFPFYKKIYDTGASLNYKIFSKVPEGNPINSIGGGLYNVVPPPSIFKPYQVP